MSRCWALRGSKVTLEDTNLEKLPMSDFKPLTKYSVLDQVRIETVRGNRVTVVSVYTI